MIAIKRLARPALERALRRVPVARGWFALANEREKQIRELVNERDLLKSSGYAPRALVGKVHLSEDQRISMTERCRDADVLPKVANAGQIVARAGSSPVQVMFNGLEVTAGGYYGEWMQELIRRCRGHHEPQEEVVFAEVLRHLDESATMIELGGFWSFYSIWFKTAGTARRSLVMEPDPAHIAIGQRNAALNGCELTFINAVSAGVDTPPAPFETEDSGTVKLPRLSVTSLMETHSIGSLDLLHCDAQGVELDIIESCRSLAKQGRLNWLIVSTHEQSISGDPLTHQRCLTALVDMGATILAEHDVHESFSGDGLIAAKFGPVPPEWVTPKLSYNRYSTSLFPNPLYGLAELGRADSAPASEHFVSSEMLAPRGGLFLLTADCPLGNAGDTLAMPFDEVMYPNVALHGCWSPEALRFLEEHVDPSVPYVVLDVGANVGLFARQVVRRFPNVARLVCVEPEVSNFKALQYNVGDLLGRRPELWNIALADHKGLMDFHRDSTNIGNFSLNDDAMRGRLFDTIQVECVDTAEWMHSTFRPHAEDQIIWKSDTQGYDELIVCRTPSDVFDRVQIAIMELWRIAKPPFDIDLFAARVDSFPNKRLGTESPCTTAEVLEFLKSDDWRHEDLYLWK